MTDNASIKIFVTGLKNAHAMEKQALSIMQPQVKRLEHYPQMRARLEQHVTETERQIERLDKIFGDLQEGHSGFKDLMLSIGGTMAALAHTPADDEVLKNSFANYAFEHYEIAAYTSLIQLSERADTPSVGTLLEETLSEERAMAQWIEDNLASVTETYVQLSNSETDASR